MQRKKIVVHHYLKLCLMAALVALGAALLALLLKHATEMFQHFIFKYVSHVQPWLLILLPTIGITAIYFLRKYAFKNRKNKGITEIYKTLDQRKDHLPLFKIPSHFFNGFLTVIFGGSTGVEVSTVVATATMGNFAYQKGFSANVYKRELICAGVVAGVAILFTSPVAGWLFAVEVIGRKWRKSLLLACTAAAGISWAFITLFEEERILTQEAVEWSASALPYFLLLSLLGGLVSVYFTLLVTRMKKLFANIENNFLRVNLGALAVGSLIYFFPQLYGDSYFGLQQILSVPFENIFSISMLLLAVAVLKPLAAALTLGAGGDGGVFAPSIVAGAFLGLAVAWYANHFFGLHLVPVNFAVVGAAVTLSASLYAPFTAVFLVCSIVPQGFVLFIPVLICCFIAQGFARLLLPYNVYTFDFYTAKP